MKKVRLFLDDFREPEDAAYINPSKAQEYETEDWAVVKNFHEFVFFIQMNGIPDVISFDHDLADEHYTPESISYDVFKEKTGYHCMKWLINCILNNKIEKLPEVYIHSQNPVGAENLKLLWYNFKKHINESRKEDDSTRIS